MINATGIINAIKQLKDARGISEDIIIEALKQAMINAYQKVTGNKDALVRVDIDPISGELKVYNQKKIVEEVMDDALEISLEDLKEMNIPGNIGDLYDIPVNINDEYNRVAANHVKQVLKQKIREAEKLNIYNAYIAKKDDIILGIVEKVEKNFCLINIGKTSAILDAKNKIPNEEFHLTQQIKVYVVNVEKSAPGAQVIVSRTEPGFLRRLFEQEVAEVYDGTVEIKAIAREPGERAKVAVYSRNPNVDAPGACIGPKGMRIQKVSSQVAGEKIDVISYIEDTELFIAEALKPAEVFGMKLNYEDRSATVVVPNNSLMLAIGKKGQNARLAVKLTNWKIDIKTIDNALAERVEYETMNEIKDRLAKEKAKKVLIKEVETPIAPVEEVIVPQTVVEPVVEDAVATQSAVIPQNVVTEPIAEPTVVQVQPQIEVPQPVVEEKVIEIVAPSQPMKSLAELEKDIERERRTSRNVGYTDRFYKNYKDRDKDKEKDKPDFRKDITTPQAQNYMPVYSEEELKELESDLEEEKNKYEEDIDYDEFDEYYDK